MSREEQRNENESSGINSGVRMQSAYFELVSFDVAASVGVIFSPDLCTNGTVIIG